MNRRGLGAEIRACGGSRWLRNVRRLSPVRVGIVRCRSTEYFTDSLCVVVRYKLLNVCKNRSERRRSGDVGRCQKCEHSGSTHPMPMPRALLYDNQRLPMPTDRTLSALPLQAPVFVSLFLGR
jgi:hypothetical protein